MPLRDPHTPVWAALYMVHTPAAAQPLSVNLQALSASVGLLLDSRLRVRSICVCVWGGGLIGKMAFGNEGLPGCMYVLADVQWVRGGAPRKGGGGRLLPAQGPDQCVGGCGDVVIRITPTRIAMSILTTAGQAENMRRLGPSVVPCRGDAAMQWALRAHATNPDRMCTQCVMYMHYSLGSFGSDRSTLQSIA